jgi:hypothetical protein
MGVKLSTSAEKQLFNNVSLFQFVDSDVEDLLPTTKHLDIHNYAEAMSLAICATKTSGKERVSGRFNYITFYSFISLVAIVATVL